MLSEIIVLVLSADQLFFDDRKVTTVREIITLTIHRNHSLQLSCLITMKIFTVSLALILLSSFQESQTAESFSTKPSTNAGKTNSVSTISSSSLFSSIGEKQEQQQQQGGPPPASKGRPGSPPQGGPPQGGPPGGAPGGPPGGPPPGGGPPPQTTAQRLLEQGLDVAFDVLYLGDEIGLQDSSKNLRVLWTRVSTVIDSFWKWKWQRGFFFFVLNQMVVKKIIQN